jgi:hypothetical protein
VYEHFAAINKLDAADQHQLLLHGDGPERLWAAWALALRVGVDVVPILERADLPAAPSGLRCHVVVVLAGLGQRDLLRVIATDECSSDVRTTAVVYFIRTAPSPTDPDALAFALAALSSDSPQLREAVLGEHEAARIRIPEADLRRRLRDPVPAVRRLALTCLTAAQQLSPSATSAVVEALVLESDADLAHALFLALPAPSMSELIRQLALASADRIGSVLALLIDADVVLEWATLEPLSQLGHSGIERSVVDLLSDAPGEPALLWLAERVASVFGEPDLLYSHWRFLALLQRGLTPSLAGLLSTSTVAGLAAC